MWVHPKKSFFYHHLSVKSRKFQSNNFGMIFLCNVIFQKNIGLFQMKAKLISDNLLELLLSFFGELLLETLKVSKTFDNTFWDFVFESDDISKWNGILWNIQFPKYLFTFKNPISKWKIIKPLTSQIFFWRNHNSSQCTDLHFKESHFEMVNCKSLIPNGKLYNILFLNEKFQNLFFYWSLQSR